MKAVVGLLSGIIFGVGLAVSGMVDRNKVLGFLDIAGQWDPSLMFVMAAALIVSVPGFYWVLKQPRPLLAEKFFLPIQKTIDKPLIIGGGIFGVGWGLYGYCPGPAVASLVYFNIDSLIFVFSMLSGIALVQLVKLK